MSEPKRPQVLPAYRIIPRLDRYLTAELATRLKDIAARGNPNVDLNFAAIAAAPVRAQRAAEFYVLAKAFQTSLPTLRKRLNGKEKGSLRNAVEALRAELQSPGDPPSPKMRSLCCYGDPEANGNESKEQHELKKKKKNPRRKRRGISEESQLA